MQDEVTHMKKLYENPSVEYFLLCREDSLTTSDNDAPFLPPLDGDDDGWSGYH